MRRLIITMAFLLLSLATTFGQSGPNFGGGSGGLKEVVVDGSLSGKGLEGDELGIAENGIGSSHIPDGVVVRSITAGATTLTDSVALTAGDNITFSASGNAVTINGGGLTPEQESALSSLPSVSGNEKYEVGDWGYKRTLQIQLNAGQRISLMGILQTQNMPSGELRAVCTTSAAAINVSFDGMQGVTMQYGTTAAATDEANKLCVYFDSDDWDYYIKNNLFGTRQFVVEYLGRK